MAGFLKGLFGTKKKKEHTYYGQSKNVDNMTPEELEKEQERWRKEAEKIARIKRRIKRKNKRRKKGPPRARRPDGRWDPDAVYKPKITKAILAPWDFEDAHKETMRPKLERDLGDYSDTGAGASTTKKRRSLTDEMRENMDDFMGGKTRKRRRKRRRKTKRKGRRKTKKRRKRRKRKTRRKR
jgi:hypothetical protein